VSYHPGHATSGLRWREDVGIEKRCDSCPKGMCWWPLTEDFWSFRSSFVKCRACCAKIKNAANARHLRENEIARLANLGYQRQYRAETTGVRRVKNQAAYWSDPERYRAAARARYYRNRDRLLERKRALYWADKGAAA